MVNVVIETLKCVTSKIKLQKTFKEKFANVQNFSPQKFLALW